MDGNIYKYTSFEYFRDIVEHGRLRFVNPFTEWQDKKEGFLFSHYDDRIEKIINEDFKGAEKLREFVIEQLKIGWINAKRVRNDGKDFYGVRATCFSNIGNSKALWRDRFHKGKSICVGFNKAFYSELNFLDSPVDLLKIEYGNWENDDFVRDVVKSCFRYKNNCLEVDFGNVLKYKSDKFSFEQESRLYFMLRNEQCHNCDVVYLKVPNIIQYIKNIYFNPCMDKEYRENIIEYCKGKEMSCNFFVYPEE